MINNFETKLASNLTLAISLTDAEKFHRDHEDIKPFVDVRLSICIVIILQKTIDLREIL
jgi:hypothetical protein